MFDLFVVFPLVLSGRSGHLALLVAKVTANKLADNQQLLNEASGAGPHMASKNHGGGKL